jgi:hypothetical protein
MDVGGLVPLVAEEKEPVAFKAKNGGQHDLPTAGPLDRDLIPRSWKSLPRTWK